MEATSLAVLPFLNLSSDPEHEYYADGITQDIIHALSGIEGLKVTSRTSSFYFKGKSMPLSEIAQKLGVEVLLEGSVRISRDQMRISVRLIEALHDSSLWSEIWDRRRENIFEVQDEISLLVADRLREQYGHFEIGENPGVIHPLSTDTYSATLKGKHLFNRWNPEDVGKAIECFEHAISIDPDYDEAYLGLADAYGFLGTLQFMPGREAWEKVSEYTQKVLEINPKNAGAYYQLANMAFFTECDFKKAFDLIGEAVDIMPNYPEAQQFLAFLYMLEDSMEEAELHLGKALLIDPLSKETLFYKAYYDYRAGRYEEALERFDSLLSENPGNIPVMVTKCYCMLRMGKQKDVVSYLNAIPVEEFVEEDRLGISCLAATMMGEEERAEEFREKLEKAAENPDSHQAHSYLFMVYANTGKFDKAFDWLESCLELKSSVLLLGFSDPLTDPIKKDPRYKLFQNRIYDRQQVKSKSTEKAPLLTREESRVLSQRLDDYMEEEEPYLNPKLTLRSLAELIQTHPNKLSWLLNASFGRNFNEFVNRYRVDRFISLAQDPENSKISLLGLAYESGFNSKTVFNASFKKEKGMTPKQYLDSKKS